MVEWDCRGCWEMKWFRLSVHFFLFSPVRTRGPRLLQLVWCCGPVTVWCLSQWQGSLDSLAESHSWLLILISWEVEPVGGRSRDQLGGGERGDQGHDIFVLSFHFHHFFSQLLAWITVWSSLNFKQLIFLEIFWNKLFCNINIACWIMRKNTPTLCSSGNTISLRSITDLALSCVLDDPITSGQLKACASTNGVKMHLKIQLEWLLVITSQLPALLAVIWATNRKSGGLLIFLSNHK